MSGVDEKPAAVRTGLAGRRPRAADARHDADLLQDYPRREIVLGVGVVAAFLLVLFGWGMWARLDAAVSAPGQIEVAGSRQAVQHRDGGIVARLNVHEGDQVAAGQVLLQLNSDELQATERSDAGQVIELQALQSRLLAELRGRRVIAWPDAFAHLTGADRQDAQVAEALQRREFDARNAALSSETQVLSQKQRESGEQISGYERQADASRQQQGLIQQEIDGLKALQARGLVPATRVRSLQRNAAELKGSEGEYAANVARTREEIGEDRIRVTDLQRQRAADDGKDYQSAEFQLSELTPKLAAVRQQIERTIVRSPATGRVVGLAIFTVGGVVAPGQRLMDVVPDREPLVIEARVKPSDVSDLKIGQRTEIRVSAFHDRGLPLLRGMVSKLSADSVNDEKTGAPYFRIEVTVPPEELRVIRQARGDAPGLKPGLPVEVVIPLRPRTALDYLVEPLRQMLRRSFREP